MQVPTSQSVDSGGLLSPQKGQGTGRFKAVPTERLAQNLDFYQAEEGLVSKTCGSGDPESLPWAAISSDSPLGPRPGSSPGMPTRAPSLHPDSLTAELETARAQECEGLGSPHSQTDLGKPPNLSCSEKRAVTPALCPST